MPDSAPRSTFLNPASPPQTFANEEDRERLSKVAIKAFKNTSDAWKLSNFESAALLGVSESTWDRLKRGDRESVLSQDQLTRASAIIGIFKGLRLLFADDMSIRWPKRPNTGPLFGGLDPVAAMVKGGIPIMLDVRRYVDAVRGGM